MRSRVLAALLLICFLFISISSHSHVYANEEVLVDDVDVSDVEHTHASHNNANNDVDVDISDDDDILAGQAGSTSSSLYNQQQYTLETLPSSGDIQTTIYFPDAKESTTTSSPIQVTKDVNGEYDSYKFQVGEEVTMLIGVQNTGIRPYNLTYITGALHSPYDHSYYIQNFTVSLINAVVDAGTEISLEYKFKSDPNLEPLQFQLEAYFLYNTTDDREVYRVTFFNKTVDLVEKSGEFNTRTLFSYLLVLSCIGIAGYYVYSTRVVKSVRRSRVYENTPQQEWTAPMYTPQDKSKPVGKRRSKKKNEN